VSVLLGNGNGTFQPAVNYSSGGQVAASVAIGDLSGDGIPDLVVANYGNSWVAVLLGNGDGTFQPAVTYGSNGPSSVALGDLRATEFWMSRSRPDLTLASDRAVRWACCWATATVLSKRLSATLPTAWDYPVRPPSARGSIRSSSRT